MEPKDSELQPNLLDFQNKPRRKNALTCEESSKMEREIKKNDQGNVNNQLIITGFSQLNLNDKNVKK